MRARVLVGTGVRDLAAAVPWARDGASVLAKGYPARSFVLEEVDRPDALAAILERHGVAALSGPGRVAGSADPARLAQALRAMKDDPAWRHAFDALSLALARWGEPAHDVRLPDGRALALSQRVHVMGIVNVTPDSFSDGGRFFDAGAAVEHGLALAADGADVLDVGAESTRPGADPVPAAEEIRRIERVIASLASQSATPISVDTMKSEVATAALDAGAQLLNDVSAGSHDAKMFMLAADRRAPIVLMHMRGEPRTMQKDVKYSDVVGEVAGFLADRASAAVEAGIDREMILVDPGFGFGKLPEHNLVLLRRLRELRCLGFPVLAGTSRKTFIGKVLDDAPPGDRLEGTAATVALAVHGGAAMVRVHDVKAMKRVVRMVEATMQAAEPGDA